MVAIAEIGLDVFRSVFFATCSKGADVYPTFVHYETRHAPKKLTPITEVLLRGSNCAAHSCVGMGDKTKPRGLRLSLVDWHADQMSREGCKPLLKPRSPGRLGSAVSPCARISSGRHRWISAWSHPGDLVLVRRPKRLACIPWCILLSPR